MIVSILNYGGRNKTIEPEIRRELINLGQKSGILMSENSMHATKQSVHMLYMHPKKKIEQKVSMSSKFELLPRNFIKETSLDI